MNTPEIAAKVGKALAMLSNSYAFELIKPTHESLRMLGNCRVVSVIVDEDDIPALGLRSPDDADDYVDYYSIDDLIIFDVMQSQAAA